MADVDLNGSVLTVNGKKLRLSLVGHDDDRSTETGHTSFTRFDAGDIIRVCWLDDDYISNDEDSEGSNDDDDKDDAASIATALVRKDFDPAVHAKISASWWYKPEEVSGPTPGISAGSELLCTDIDQVDPACVVDRCTDDLRLLPPKVSNRLYNKTKGLLEHATASRAYAPDFKFVKQLLLLRLAAKAKLKARVRTPDMRKLKCNQVAVSIECLHEGLHAFDRSHPSFNGKKLRTPDNSQQIAAWVLCFGPILLGDALWQMQQLASFDAHKEV